MQVSMDSAVRKTAALNEAVPVLPNGQSLLSEDAARRFVTYGELAWSWWVEVAPDGTELPGL